jgi:hypothetical protein
VNQHFQIELQALPNHPAPPARRLAALLKAALRRFGFICTGYREVAPPSPPDAPSPVRKDSTHGA